MTGEQTVLQAKRLGVFHCHKTALLGDAVRQMVSEDISALVVVDPEGYLEGIVTRFDLLRALVEHDDWSGQQVSMYMAREVVTVSQHTTLREVAELLLQKHIHRVVVARQEEQKQVPLAVVSAADLVYHMAR
jgi:signal-transduction protein with cAMP-binding, CBS, and nucleotidyltransferase domain